MRKLVLLITVFWATTAAADVDAYFGKGVLNASWGTTLQNVQAMYPDGTVWPYKDAERIREVIYAVPGNVHLLNTDLKITMVQFVFTKQNQLQRVFFHFRFEDQGSALYDIAQVLGQNYSISDQAGSRAYFWKRGKLSLAAFEASTDPQFPWCFFAVQSPGIEPYNGR